MVERAEKQIILARHARRLLNYVDDSPVVPGDARQAYDHELEARQVLEDAENDLRSWVPTVDPIPTAINDAFVFILCFIPKSKQCICFTFN